MYYYITWSEHWVARWKRLALNACRVIIAISIRRDCRRKIASLSVRQKVQKREANKMAQNRMPTVTGRYRSQRVRTTVFPLDFMFLPLDSSCRHLCSNNPPSRALLFFLLAVLRDRKSIAQRHFVHTDGGRRWQVFDLQGGKSTHSGQCNRGQVAAGGAL